MERDDRPREDRKLNMPRPCSVVLLGAYHEHASLLILLVSLVPIGVLIVARDHLNDALSIGLVVLCLLLLILGQYLLFAPFTRFLKRYVIGSFRVLYFRSFREEQSHEARDLLAPILGCIGRLTTIYNKTYIQGLTGTEGHDHSEKLWLIWLQLGEILSDGLEAVKCEGDSWRQEVRGRLAGADLVVIDGTVRSENVDWELNQAREFLPKDRVFVIHAVGSKNAATEDSVEYELSPRGRRQFRLALRKKLIAIKSFECFSK